MSQRLLVPLLVLVAVAAVAEDAADELRAGEAGAFKGKTLEEAVAMLEGKKGDVGFGKLQFAQRCQRCHAMQPGPATIGPYLGLTADQMDRTALLKAIIMPGAELAFGYEMKRYTLDDGKTVDGSLVEDTADSIRIATVKGEMKTLVKDRIKDETGLGTSLMPADVARAITVDQMAHLLAFVESMKTKTE